MDNRIRFIFVKYRIYLICICDIHGDKKNIFIKPFYSFSGGYQINLIVYGTLMHNFLTKQSVSTCK